MSDFDRVYLILHKVRGEPAFDVALRSAEMLEATGDEWIIPTSGHTAHPYWAKPLRDYLGDDIKASVPDDLPDHYRVYAEPHQVLTLSSLGFVPKGGNVTKRSLT